MPKVGVCEGESTGILCLLVIYYTNYASDSKLRSMDNFQVHQLGVEIGAWGTSRDITWQDRAVTH